MELKNCPFCGEKVTLKRDIGGFFYTRFMIAHDKNSNCNCVFAGKAVDIEEYDGQKAKMKEEIINAWNTRPGDGEKCLHESNHSKAE